MAAMCVIVGHTPRETSDLIVNIQLIGVALLYHQPQQVSIAVDFHAFELPGLMPRTLIAVKA